MTARAAQSDIGDVDDNVGRLAVTSESFLKILNDPAGAAAKSKSGGIVVAQYDSTEPTGTGSRGHGVVRPFPFVPGDPGSSTPDRWLPVDQERLTLQSLLQAEQRVKKAANRCIQRVLDRKDTIPRCFEAVLRDLERTLEREARRGSKVAQEALPIVREAARQVRSARSGQEARQAVRTAVSKVQQIKLVASDDAVIARVVSQQRNAIVETLAFVEICIERSTVL